MADDGTQDLWAEFRALPARDRRALLKSFAADERAKLAARLAAPALPGSTAAPSPADEPFACFSPWLAALLGDGPDGEAMTPAARILFRRSAEGVAAASRPGSPPRERGRSLVGQLVAALPMWGR